MLHRFLDGCVTGILNLLGILLWILIVLSLHELFTA